MWGKAWSRGGLVVALLAGEPGAALACSLGGSLYEGPTREAGEDERPPEAIRDVEVEVHRGREPDGCEGERGGIGSDCAGAGAVELSFAPPDDDVDPPEALAYVFELVDGDLPRGFLTRAEPQLGSVSDGRARLWLHWSDGIHDEQEEVDFTIDLRPLDAAGLMGPAVRVHVHDGGRDGCSVVRGSPSAPLWLLVFAGWLDRMRRRRARR